MIRWIGQHIWDFVSRFRNDVYLENIADGTVASDKFLGLDSNNKIVKETITSGSGDITSVNITTDSGAVSAAEVASGDANFEILGSSGVGVTNSSARITAVAVPGEIDHDSLLNFVANEHLRWDNDVSATATINAANIPTLNQNTTGSSASCTGQAATVATIAGLAPNTATTQATQPNITSIGTDGDTLNVLADTFRMSNATSLAPAFNLINTTDDANGPVITLQSGRDAAGQDNDFLGTIKFTGYDDQGTPAIQNYAQIYAQIHDATSGEESGSLSFTVANHDGGSGEVGLKLIGGSEDGEIDVTVGNGANSVVTVPGRIVDKRYRILQASFRDDIQTTKHYVPLAGVDEQTVLTRADACAQLAVCDGRLVSATVRVESMSGGGDTFTLTMGVETNTVGSSYEGTFAVTETEAMTVNTFDDHHAFHFVFDTAKHWDSTDMFAVSIESSADHFGSNERWFVTLVVEDDWSTYLGGNREGVSSTEFDTAP
jgi:hypothetical protein